MEKPITGFVRCCRNMSLRDLEEYAGYVYMNPYLVPIKQLSLYEYIIGKHLSKKRGNHG